MAMPLDAQANDLVIKEIKQLAKTTLTHKQYLCHNEIVFRESSWNHRAVGNIGGTKQAYGLYQMKMESLKKAYSSKAVLEVLVLCSASIRIVDSKTKMLTIVKRYIISRLRAGSNE
jgi:hypothetical protein